MITMVSFVSWMKEQEKREQDPVGWFARYWRDLEHPRLSSPASIAKWLEDQGLFQSVNGLTEGYDTTLAEYRHVREGVVRDTAQGAGITLPEHGPQEPAEPPGQGLAGQAVAHATQEGLAAAQAQIPLPDLPRRAQTGTGAMLEEIRQSQARCAMMLGMIMGHLGLAVPPDGAELDGDLPWADWHQQAVVYALAHGPDWDQPGEGA